MAYDKTAQQFCDIVADRSNRNVALDLVSIKSGHTGNTVAVAVATRSKSGRTVTLVTGFFAVPVKFWRVAGCVGRYREAGGVAPFLNYYVDLES